MLYPFYVQNHVNNPASVQFSLIQLHEQSCLITNDSLRFLFVCIRYKHTYIAKSNIDTTGANGRDRDRRTGNGNTPIQYCRRSCSCEFNHSHVCNNQARGLGQPQPTSQLSPSQPTTQSPRDRNWNGSLRNSRRQQLEQYEQQLRGRNNHQQQQQQWVELGSNRDGVHPGGIRQQQLIQPPEFTSTLSPGWSTSPNNRPRRGNQWFAFIGNSHGTLPPPTSTHEQQNGERRARPVRPPTYPPHSSVQH